MRNVRLVFVEDCLRVCQTKSTLYWLLRIGGYSLEFEMRNMKKTKFGAFLDFI